MTVKKFQQVSLIRLNRLVTPKSRVSCLTDRRALNLCIVSTIKLRIQFRIRPKSWDLALGWGSRWDLTAAFMQVWEVKPCQEVTQLLKLVTLARLEVE